MLTEELALSTESIGRLADIILTLQRCFIMRLSENLAGGDVSFAQFFLLSHINSCCALSMTEIAAKMTHTTAAATGLVDRLERLDYVERTTAPNDRRKVLVRIKPKGVELVKVIHLDMVNSLAKVMHELTVEEQHMWLQIYEKIFNYCQCQEQNAPAGLPSRD
ncbi:MAG TPA: MarR family transcriptional regulator [Chthoniobacterales bacterium]|jgi:DNA-binding MarR family transcriptional regulator